MRGGRVRGTLDRLLRWARASWLDIVWAIFVGINLALMQIVRAWATIPFLVIWISLTLVYGFRMWRMQPAMLTVAVVTLATGGIIGAQVADGQQDTDYLVLVPMVALMFLSMVWHGRRRQAALVERLAAMEEVQRVSRENLRLLEQQRLFLLDASHELGTPITVALGHAELIEQAVGENADAVAEDAKVVVGELARLRRLSSRLLLLASAGNPGFLDLAPVEVDSLVIDALDRWGYTPRRWRLGEVAEATILADRDRLAVALDALLENAIAHTGIEDQIELSVRIAGGSAILAVADSGCGIPEEDLERIFGRFARAKPFRSREVGGFGLGLPIAVAIAEAHHGQVRVHSTVGNGSTFELVIPVAVETAAAETAAAETAAVETAAAADGGQESPLPAQGRLPLLGAGSWPDAALSRRGGGGVMTVGEITSDGRARVLADGGLLPMLGLGVWQVPNGPLCVNAVRWALELGYRHIDTAQAYGNEESVGIALRDSGVPREDVFLTTKFYPGHRDPVAEAEHSLRRLGVDQMDLYLIHWPQRGPTWAWPGMERARERGLTRFIGVSNFGATELDQVAGAGSTVPAVNQIQFNPFAFRRALLGACARLGVAAEAYSPLGTGRHLSHPAIRRVAQRVSRTPAQVLLRWCLQHGLPAIPKSTHRDRIAENAEIFDFTLSGEDMAELDALDQTGGTGRALERGWW